MTANQSADQRSDTEEEPTLQIIELLHESRKGEEPHLCEGQVRHEAIMVKTVEGRNHPSSPEGHKDTRQ